MQWTIYSITGIQGLGTLRVSAYFQSVTLSSQLFIGPAHALQLPFLCGKLVLGVLGMAEGCS